MSSNNNNIKEFKDINVGDILISHNVSSNTGIMPSWSEGVKLFVLGKDSSMLTFIGTGKGRKSYESWNVERNHYDKYRQYFDWFNGNNKLDLAPIQEQLLELPVVERILPKDQRINEEVFNLVKDGELPDQEEMRLLLLKYHKALVTAEENIQLYNKILFDDGNANPISNNAVQPAEVMEMSYGGNSFLTKSVKTPPSKKSMFKSPVAEEPNFNWQAATTGFDFLYGDIPMPKDTNTFYKEEMVSIDNLPTGSVDVYNEEE